jgi:BASS family bile acid:Na+ symporter
MFMLFMSFLGIKVTHRIFSKNIILILIVNIGLGFLWYFIVLPFNQTFALIAFITAITPTATAAPAVVHFLKGKVEYITASVILTNLVIALCLPIFISILHAGKAGVFAISSLQNIFIVIIIPLLLAQGIHFLLPTLGKAISKYKTLSFYCWIAVVFLAVAKSSQFILTHKEIPLISLIIIGILVLIICAVNFTLGRIIGGKEFGLEGSQALGQKNTTFSIWYALSFLNPLIALGPVFYLVYHNVYNSYQMFKKDRSG